MRAASVKNWLEDSWECSHMLKTRVFWLQCNLEYNEITCCSVVTYFRIVLNDFFFSFTYAVVDILVSTTGLGIGLLIG